MENNLIFDVSIIFFILVSALFAFSRGFSQEVLSLFSWVSAFFISFFCSKFLVGYINILINNFLISKISSYILVFIISLFILSYVTSKFSYTVKKSSVGAIDRSLGFIFGIARGYILLCLILFTVSNFYFEKLPKWLDESKMNYLLMHGATKIVYFFDKDNNSAKVLEDKIKTKSEKLFEKSIDSHLRREKKSDSSGKGYKKSDRENLDYLIENSNND